MQHQEDQDQEDQEDQEFAPLDVLGASRRT